LWGRNNLSAEEYTQFQGLAQTAGQVKIIEKIIGMAKNSKLANRDGENNLTKEDQAEELRKMQLAVNDKNQRLMEIDPEYRKKVTAAMKSFYGE
jgi:hypothetical protein